MGRLIPRVVIGVLLSVTLMPSAFPPATTASGAFDVAAQSLPSGVSVESVSSILVKQLPVGSVPVSMALLSVASAATLPLDRAPGTTVYLVAAGRLTVEAGASRSLTIMRASANGATTVVVGKPESAGAGDAIIIPAGAGGQIRNDETGDSSILAIKFFADEGGPAQVTSERRVATSVVLLPAGAVHLEFESLMLAYGAVTDPETVDGTEMLVVTAGGATAALHPGVARIRRTTGGQEVVVGGPADPFASPGPDDEPNEPGEVNEVHEPAATAESESTPVSPPMHGSLIRFGRGDAALVEGGSTLTLQGTTEEPAALLLVRVVPVASSPATPAP